MCGDEPTTEENITEEKKLTPHVWGWTGRVKSEKRMKNINPTCVGMNRVKYYQFNA